MKEHLTVTLAVVGALMGGGGASAQTAVPFDAGARVRVSGPVLPAPLYGHVVMEPGRSDVFTVSTPDGNARVTMPLASTSRVDVSRGRARVRSGLIAGGVGMFVGGVVGSRLGEGDPYASAFAAAVFAGTGSVLGGVLGVAYAPERWRTVHTATATSKATYRLVLRSSAQVRRFDDGTIAVRGERNRRVGAMRGTLVLGGIGLAFGGIDRARGNITGSEYAATVLGNAAVGAALGYLISPRGWQRLPPPGGSASQ